MKSKVLHKMQVSRIPKVTETLFRLKSIGLNLTCEISLTYNNVTVVKPEKDKAT